MAEDLHNPVLEGFDLTRSFTDGKTSTQVLNGVSVELYPGQMTLLMGPSGSGKTTLLACLSGLLHPDGGRVVAMGEDLWAMSEAQRERFRLKYFGFIFQGYNLFSALTARQQLEMVLNWGEGIHGAEARRRADEVLDMLGMSKKADLRPGALSGGEKQRVAIGRALVKRPRLLFADEPTSALDWAHGKEVIEHLKHVAHDTGAAVLVVAHDARIKEFVDRELYMEDGQLRDRATDDDSGEHSVVGARVRLGEHGVF